MNILELSEQEIFRRRSLEELRAPRYQSLSSRRILRHGGMPVRSSIPSRMMHLVVRCVSLAVSWAVVSWVRLPSSSSRTLLAVSRSTSRVMRSAQAKTRLYIIM